MWSSSKSTGITKLLFLFVLSLCFFILQLVTTSRCLPSGGNKELLLSAMTSASTSESNIEYEPASVEEYIMNNFEKLGYNKENEWVSGCAIYKDPNETTEENYRNLINFRRDLDTHSQALQEFMSDNTRSNDGGSQKVDLLKKIRQGNYERTELCKQLRLHPDGLQALFPSKQLSLTKSGYVEPLIPPLRSPHFCGDNSNQYGLSLNFLVHDFEAICLNLKPWSRIVLVDMGAALDFHDSHVQMPPMIELMTTFEKFGLRFDHIYAFEINGKDPNKVYREYLPIDYFTSYHWINTGVSADKDDKMNPLVTIVKQFDEDDFILVKLDIDTSDIENKMAKLLLEDDSINRLVDHFYFEHHIMISEIKKWGSLASGTFKDSLELMNGLRKKGVASHYWP